MANYYLNNDGSLTRKNPKKKKGNNYILQSDGSLMLNSPIETNPTKKKPSVVPSKNNTTQQNTTVNESVFDNYKHYMDAKDFGSNSKYKSTKSDAWHRGLTTSYGLGFEDVTYEYINNVDGIREKINDKERVFNKDTGDSATSQEKKGYNRLNEEEIAVYNYLYRTKGKKKAQEFLDDMEMTLTKRVYDEQTKKWKDIVDDSSVKSTIMSVASIPANIIGAGQSTMENIANILQGKEYNPYGYYKSLSNFSENTRQFVGQNIAESTKDAEILGQNIPSFLYQTGMSAADSALGVLFLGSGYSVLAGASSANQRAKELKEAGATTEEIARGAAASGFFEMFFEKFSLDNLLRVKNADTFAKMTKEVFKQAGVEATEEMLTETANILFDSFSRGKTSDGYTKYKEYLDSGYTKKEARQKMALELSGQVLWSGVGGALSGAALGGGNVLVQNQKTTKLTENEKKVVESVMKSRIAKKESEGTKVTAKEKAQIRKDVEQALKDGDISIDTIESALGGETLRKYNSLIEQEESLTKQLKELGKLPNTVENAKKYDEVNAKLKEMQGKSEKTALKEQLSKEVSDMTLSDTYIRESYNEKGRRSQAFEADLSKYDKKQQATIQKAIDSKILNNTNKTHKFVDLLAKISADKGVSFDFTDNARIKESGFAVQGATVNGYVKDGNVTLNINSAKALNSVVGHEITHVLEGTEHYAALQEAVFEYAKTKKDYDGRLKTLTELYKNVENADLNKELTADLIGDYLFTDEKFVQQLSTQNRNVFQKIYDEIKYLVKTVTSGSKEAKQLEKVKKLFDDAYKENVKTEAKDNVQLSLVGKDENGVEIYETSEETKKLTYAERKAKLLETMKNEYAGRTAKFVKNGKAYYAQYNNAGLNKGVHGDNKSDKKGYNAKINIGVDGNYIELVENARYDKTSVEQGKSNKFHSDAKQWDYYVKTIQSDGMYFDVLINVKDTGKEQYVYDITLKEATHQRALKHLSLGEAASKDSISQNQQKTTENHKKSLSNNDIAPTGSWNVRGKDISLEGAPIRQDVAPAQKQEAAVDDMESWPSDEDLSEGPFTTEDVPEEDMDEQEAAISKKNAERIKNIKANIKGFQMSRDITEKEFDTNISAKTSEYESLQRKDTKRAAQLLTQIENLKYRKENVLAEVDKKIQQQRKAIRNIENSEVSRRRKSKQQQYRSLMSDLMGDTSTWKDKRLGISYQTNTLRRNLRDIVRDEEGNRDIAKADALYEELQGKYNQHEAELHREANRIKQFFKDMRINKAENEYIQMLGEYRHNPDSTITPDVMKEFYEKNKDKIDKAKVDKAIAEARKVYDSLFYRVNSVLKEHGFRELGYKEGYFPHFTEDKQHWLAKILNWKTQNNDIPTDIAGLTEQFNPERSWQSFDKHRTGDKTDYNFMKGLDTYVQGSLDWIYHIEDIQKRRALENEIRYQHSDKGIQEKLEEIYNSNEYDTDQMQEQIDLVLKTARNPLNNFVTDLRNSTNNLAGKKDTADRSLEYATNRHIYSTMTNLSNRVSANMVGGSISSALTNFIPITQSWGEVKPVSSLKAMRETIKSYVLDDGMVDKSDFMTNRLRTTENLYQTNWDKISDGVSILMEGIDNFTTQVVWRSKYMENVQNGMSEDAAVKNADQFAENILAGRSRGNMPTIFNSKNPITKVFTAFQLEVNNQYGYMFKDMPQDMRNETKGKLVKGYATMFIGAYVYNALYSTLTGRDAALDPIGIIEQLLRDLGAFGEEEEKEPLETLYNLGGNIVEEMPFIGGLLGGGRIPISSALPYDGPKEAITGTLEDISDKNWKNLTWEWLNPVFYLGMPVGGGQTRKTIQGLSMFDKDLPISGSYTNSGQLRFPVEKTPANVAQAAVFGQYASENARDYFENNRSPLKDKQLEEFLESKLPIKEYWDYRDGLKGKTKFEEKADYIAGLDIPISAKNVLINNQSSRKEEIDLTDYDLFETFEEFDFATKNPEKYAISKAVGGYKAYTKYTKTLNGIVGSKDKSGKTISGSRKEKVLNYIKGLEIGDGEKMILFKREYPSDNRYNSEIIDYLSSRNDISYQDRKTILKELGFTVGKDGIVRW